MARRNTTLLTRKSSNTHQPPRPSSRLSSIDESLAQPSSSSPFSKPNREAFSSILAAATTTNHHHQIASVTAAHLSSRILPVISNPKLANRKPIKNQKRRNASSGGGKRKRSAEQFPQF
ncbi:hypothetical protein LR48_Vigan511s005300 [Vigna angularis]|uniref:Uncharacterized protein n=1 Tax=Phaseolus angularis TaxID=3914 RepID=A0A0L9TC83_PHAAN|nr:hypothetical protein LR48_Vigan511s005300 [Vigna angularis]